MVDCIPLGNGLLVVGLRRTASRFLPPAHNLPWRLCLMILPGAEKPHKGDRDESEYYRVCDSEWSVLMALQSVARIFPA